MTEEHLNLAFNLEREKMEDTIKFSLNGDLNGYDRIIPLRDLKSINEICMFRREVFEAIIRNIPLRGTKNLPYADAEIEVFGREPKGLRVGQTFVLDRKILSIMSSFGLEGISGDYVMKGISKMPPTRFYGTDAKDEKVMAFYFPPIVEIHKDNAVLIDGMHRNFICGTAGTTVNAIHINNVGYKLPFEPIRWGDCKLVSEKPPKEQRYRSLDASLFRDLGAVGIDG